MAVAVRPFMPGHSHESNLWVEMCIFIAAMAWLVRMAMQRRLRLVRTGMGLPALVLLAIAVVSTIRSPHKIASIATLLDWLSYAALFFVIVSATAESFDRRFFLRLLWASAFVVILYGIFQQFVNMPLLREQIESDRERVQLQLGLHPKLIGDLMARAEGRIFSTFLLANSFAGFLALVFPGFVGYVLDRLRAGERRKPFLAVSALWVAGALACLLLTYSKGGWLAFAIGCLVFCVMLGGAVLRRHARLVAGVVLAGALGVGGLFAAKTIPTRIFGDAVASFDVRVGYWRGAVAMARDNLLGGVGLGTFGSHYALYRWPQARVAQRAHNDYLEVLAELGVFGLIAFVWLWAAYLRSAARRRQEAGGGGLFPPRAGYVAGILAFAMTHAVAGTFSFAGWGTESWWPIPKAWCDLGLVVVLGAAWLAFFAALGRGERGAPGELCRKGLLCGMIAFLLHCAVDFDYHQPRVALMAWVVAALSAAPRREAFERRLRPWVAFCLGAGAILAVFGYQFVMMRAARAEVAHDIAKDRLVKAREAEPGPPRANLIREAREHYERALRQNPLDDNMRVDYADMLVGLLMPTYDDQQLFRRAAGLYARAAELNPASAGPHDRLARLCEQAADAGARPPLLLALVRQHSANRPPLPNPIYLPAVVEYEAAIERDPKKPRLRLDLAIALEKLGDLDGAVAQVELAQNLHELVLRKHPQHVLRLSGEELKRAQALLERVRKRRQPRG